MAKGRAKAAAPAQHHGYEFGGPLGTLGISIGLPLVCYLTAFLCNDVSGCPVPSVLHPSQLSLETLKRDAGWPANGVLGLINAKAFGSTLAYYFLSAVLQAVLPGEEVQGVSLRSGGKLNYKFNSFNTAVLTLGVALAGTIAQGPDFALWTFMYNNYVPILTSNLIISLLFATFVYVRSFSVKAGNAEHRELAEGGHSGNIMYDWFIGRELNPRITVPILGTFDIKTWCELRPGMLGWLLLDCAFVAHQYKVYGYVTDSIILITLSQFIYVLDALYMESSMLTTIDITTDGFGFMLAFGDLVWLPFTYSWQARYLAVYPVNLGILGTVGVLTVQGLGYYIFRSANNEKNRFRTNPKDPRVAHLEHIKTKSGSTLITSGWWGRARHINYFGDWLMSWAYCLPTGISGYIIQRHSSGVEVTQGEARGWGMVVTYFYMLYFAVLLIHREMRDEEKCTKKYGKDWEAYKKKVPYRIVPGIY
ncbi:MAG: hypothetical protein M4579_006809 [Chaenotheca gracillima]|nr:MAG: hypothetical protein M4579_006809 [Chaenotheca gracillima]